MTRLGLLAYLCKIYLHICNFSLFLVTVVIVYPVMLWMRYVNQGKFNCKLWYNLFGWQLTNVFYVRMFTLSDTPQ